MLENASQSRQLAPQFCLRSWGCTCPLLGRRRLGRRLQQSQQQLVAALTVIASLIAHRGEDSMSDDQPVSAQVLADEELEAAFAPYINAAGQVVHSWNQLQESLGKLFAAITGKASMALAIWHTPHSDRTQRDMLTAAINETSDEKWKGYSHTAKADILALVAVANGVADRRNNAIHAPVSLAIDRRKLVPIPIYFHGNPRALRLKDKDVIMEFNVCIKRSKELRDMHGPIYPSC
jgi:hypothetical protein